MSRSHKVRFNLGRGKNYMKWKVTYSDGQVVYYNPDEVQLVMNDCVFKNHKSTAQKIFDGANKTVCAWILCKDIIVTSTINHTDETRQVRYNPRVQPNWVMDGHIMDNDCFPQLHTIDRRVFVTVVQEEYSLATNTEKSFV